ncbi:MAG: tRNA (adenosine(37)-N6)-threonylcarbamoyltransferase complex dimerization subunit type 1 TsaB [Pyrinomonadaceae bacterium]
MSITLALESAIAGGSISLLDGEEEIARWVGSSDVSKAEELLANIDAIARDSGLTRRDFDRIAVSAGPGSFTGIRIGLATVLGLKTGLGVKMQSVSALEAIAAPAADKAVVVAVPMGRNSVCLQHFSQGAADHPYTIDNERFVELIRQDGQNSYLVHDTLYSAELQLPSVSNFGWNVARAIGIYAVTHPDVSVEPLFISKSPQ